MTVKKSYFTPATSWSQDVKLTTFICASGGDNTIIPDPMGPPGGAPERKPLV